MEIVRRSFVRPNLPNSGNEPEDKPFLAKNVRAIAKRDGTGIFVACPRQKFLDMCMHKVIFPCSH